MLEAQLKDYIHCVFINGHLHVSNNCQGDIKTNAYCFIQLSSQVSKHDFIIVGVLLFFIIFEVVIYHVSKKLVGTLNDFFLNDDPFTFMTHGNSLIVNVTH